MTLTPSQRASLASALQIMFDALHNDDIACVLMDVLGMDRLEEVYEEATDFEMFDKLRKKQGDKP